MLRRYYTDGLNCYPKKIQKKDTIELVSFFCLLSYYQYRLSQELSKLSKYVPLTIDSLCIEDVARMFRVPHTTNTKAN